MKMNTCIIQLEFPLQAHRKKPLPCAEKAVTASCAACLFHPIMPVAEQYKAYPGAP
jgi:hypothetical protein